MAWEMGARSRGLASRAKIGASNRAISRVGAVGSGSRVGAWAGSSAAAPLVLMMILAAALPLAGREKDKLTYGEGLIVNIPLPESEVEQVVGEVVQNGVIRGTKEYNKDEFVGGAKAASSSGVFPAWNEGGKVFYKVREQAIDPRNFKDTSDVGTLAVRYVVLAQGDKNTVLRIDALFKEDFRHLVHQSDGSVENAEYKDIREHVEAIELMKKQNAEALSRRSEQLEKKQSSSSKSDVQAWPVPQSEPQAPAQAVQSQEDAAAPTGVPPSGGQQLSNEGLSSQSVPGEAAPSPTMPAQIPGQTLEERVKNLRQQVERVVKSPGAPLKSAPFHTASTLQSLSTGTEVLIVISTPYWYGVETHDGQHGWVMRDELEQK